MTENVISTSALTLQPPCVRSLAFILSPVASGSAEERGQQLRSVLRDDVQLLLSFVLHAKRVYDQLPRTVLRLLQSARDLQIESIRSSWWRTVSVGLQLTIENTKRESADHHRQSNALSPMLVSEHFHRDAQLQYFHDRNAFSHDKTLLQTPWRGTQYRAQLLSSLLLRLRQKFVFSVLLSHFRSRRQANQSVEHLRSLRQKHLLQLCFSALLLEALACALVTNCGMQRVAVFNKTEKSAFRRDCFRLLASLRANVRQNRNCVRAEAWHRRQGMRFALSCLSSWKRRKRTLRLQAQFAELSDRQFRQRFVVAAWQLAIVFREELRTRIMRRYGDTECSNIKDSRSINVASIQNALVRLRLAHWRRVRGHQSFLTVSQLAAEARAQDDMYSLQKLALHSLRAAQLLRDRVALEGGILTQAAQVRQREQSQEYQQRESSMLHRRSNRCCEALGNISLQITDHLMTLSTNVNAKTFTNKATESDSSEDECDDKSLPETQLFADTLSTHVQLCKIVWIVQRARRFLSILRRRSAQRRCCLCISMSRRLHLLHTSLLGWTVTFRKLRQQELLCDKLFDLNLARKIIFHWKQFVDHKFSNRRLVIASFLVKNCLKRSLRNWRRLFTGRKCLMRFTTTRVLQICRRSVNAWKQYSNEEKRFRRCASAVARLMEFRFFEVWSEKFRSRRLLRKVFLTREVIVNEQRRFRDSPFRLLRDVLVAWHEYVSERSDVRRQKSQSKRALLFRGIALMSTCLRAWILFTANKRHFRQCHKLHQKHVVRVSMRAWRALHTQFNDSLAAATRTVEKRLMQRCFRGWLFFRVLQCTGRRIETLRSTWKSWKQACCLRRLAVQVESLHATAIASSAFWRWRKIKEVGDRYHQAIELLQNISNRVSIRLAFSRFPGLAALRKLTAHLQQRDGHRIVGVRLVDRPLESTAAQKGFCENGNEGHSEAHREQRGYRLNHSFLRRKPLTIREVAVRCGFLDSVFDVDVASSLETLVHVVFQQWQIFVESARHSRASFLAVYSARQHRMQQRVMWKWQSLTPQLAHRIVSWMHNRKLSLLSRTDHVSFGELVSEDSLLGLSARAAKESLPGETEEERRYRKFLALRKSGLQVEDMSLFSAGQIFAMKRLQEQRKKRLSRAYDWK